VPNNFIEIHLQNKNYYSAAFTREKSGYEKAPLKILTKKKVNEKH